MTKYEKMADRFAKSGLDKDVFEIEAGRKGSTLRYYLQRVKKTRSVHWHRAGRIIYLRES